MSSFVRGEAVTGFPFTLRHSQTGAAITSGTVTGYVTLDGGTQTALAGTPVHEGLGQWSIDLAATETDGDLLGLLFVHADGFASFTVETSSSPETSLTVGSPGEVEICKLALVEGLGAQPITSLDDDSNAAKSCKRLYPQCRNELLVDLCPAFAVTRALLAQLATAPVYDFTYRYQLPTDCLFPLETDYPGETWRQESNTLVSYYSPCYLKYIKRVTDTSLFSPSFVKVLTAYLTARLAFPITKSAAMVDRAMAAYQQIRDEGSAEENQIGTPATLVPSTLTNVRF